ncbi:MAG: MmcQ/YjbR family DNA-binding protein [Lysobacter sp.]|nr:MmcQ/YjbR family DNA-binding protein [Lysobacter sp.]
MKPESLRAVAGAWPGVTEDIKWGADLVFSVVGKMFCVLDTGGSGRLSFKVEDERFLELTERPGVIPAPYLARARWVSVVEPRVLAEAELHALLRRSYELVRAKLPKAEQRRLAAMDVSRN